MTSLRRAISNNPKFKKHDGVYLLSWKHLSASTRQGVVLVKNGIVDESGEPFEEFLQAEADGMVTLTRMIPAPNEGDLINLRTVVEVADQHGGYTVTCLAVRNLLDSWKVAPSFAPCPFCGTSNIKVATLVEVGDKYAAECLHCKAWGPVSDTSDEAVQAWNRRAGEGSDED